MVDQGPTDALSVHTLLDIEDRLFRSLSLDVWERCFYYYLLRHTHAAGVPSNIFALGKIAKATGTSDTKVRESIRNMHSKGCIRIDEPNKKGHFITVFLPRQIEGLRPIADPPREPDLEELDFYTERRYLDAILVRDANACFYCLRTVDEHSVVLDHVVPLADGGTNRHSNIVSSCHECNSVKQAMAATEFMRDLYRRRCPSCSVQLSANRQTEASRR